MLACTAVGEVKTLPAHTSLVEHHYLSLNASGSVVLAASFNDDVTTLTPANLLKDKTLSLTLNVQSSVPAGHTILTLHKNGGEVQIAVLSGLQVHLTAFNFVLCKDSQGNQRIGGYFGWQPMRGNMLSEPDCAGTQAQWIYAVGAAGYETVAAFHS